VSLDNFTPLIGRWRLSGETEGEIAYRWADENHTILFRISISGSSVAIIAGWR
jgi:hypothetical protein